MARLFTCVFLALLALYIGIAFVFWDAFWPTSLRLWPEGLRFLLFFSSVGAVFAGVLVNKRYVGKAED